ncbi:MAG: aminotransferase class V-fold PLP-dependent enzyme [Clostridiales bacterium]|jgi:cysteine desulfurase family protein|nr:aminotransferase class V-fold PLP-dependent enzyme [Clostridiales bacterium]
MNSIYLDNAATSFPKPPGVALAMARYINEIGSPLNRSTYGAAADAADAALQLRTALKALFHFPYDETHVIITPGATIGLNMAIKGYVKPGDHVLVSAMEHNAVMRPLMQLACSGVMLDRIPADAQGILLPETIAPLVRPNTTLLVVTHASNVSGGINPIEKVARIARQFGIPLVLDAAQSAGHIPIDFGALTLAAMAVPAHKGLLGPGGIGALLLAPVFAAKLTPLIAGGTGSASDSEELPPYMPDRFECGTLNIPGIFGFLHAIEYMAQHGRKIWAHETLCTRRFLEGVAGIPGVRLMGPPGLEGRVGVISLDFIYQDNADVAETLDTRYGILTRCGLHCAPNAHKTLHTFPKGTVRFSIGPFTTLADIDAAIAAIQAIAKG